MSARLLKLLSIAPLLFAMLVWQACGGSSVGRPLTNSSSLVSIQITPSTQLLPLASSRQLIATGAYSDGSSVDLTSKVTWSSSSGSSTTNFASITSGGLVTGTALGASVVSATMGSITGVLNVVVNTNGFSYSTAGLLTVTLQKNLVDVAYLPQNQAKNPKGLYTVQEINLDEDLFSSTIPASTALVYSIPMPAGYVPNAAVASQSSLQVAVISYTSPDVQIIDASNDPTDLSNNFIAAKYTAPVSKTTILNGITCMICAAVINPVDNHLLVSTSQGYFSMDLSSGTFTALPFTPTALTSQSFTLNPVAAIPYILNPSTGNGSGELQTLNLNANTATTVSNLGLVSPVATPMSIFAGLGVVTDGGASSQALLNLANPQAPASLLVPSMATCDSAPLSMAALGVVASNIPDQVSPTLFLSRTGGNCVGFEAWPTTQSGLPFDPTQIGYGYGTMPDTPDGAPFKTGTDPNAIGTFTSIVDKKNYGFLIDSTGNWVAKMNLLNVASQVSPSTPLPQGYHFPSTALYTGLGGAPVVYLSAAADTGVVTVTSGSNDVLWVSGAQFAIGGQWNSGTITLGGTLPGCVGGTSYVVASVLSPSELNVSSNFQGSSGKVNYCFPGTPIPLP